MIHFPFYDVETGEQRFPFRTFLMLASIVIQLSVSVIAKSVFYRDFLSSKYDVFNCFPKNNKAVIDVLKNKLNPTDGKVVEEEALFPTHSSA